MLSVGLENPRYRFMEVDYKLLRFSASQDLPVALLMLLISDHIELF